MPADTGLAPVPDATIDPSALRTERVSVGPLSKLRVASSTPDPTVNGYTVAVLRPTVPVNAAVDVGEPSGDGVGVGEGSGVADSVGVGDGVAEGDGLGDGVADDHLGGSTASRKLLDAAFQWVARYEPAGGFVEK